MRYGRGEIITNRMNDITFRPATLADAAQIIALDQAIFGAYGGDEEPDIIRARLAVFPAGCLVLEAADGRMAGYLTTEKWAAMREPALDEHPADTHDPHGRVLNVTTFAIAPDFQNHGLGVKLLNKTINLAKEEGCTQIVLETANAKRFYTRHHFEHIGTRFQRGIKLFIMRLRI